MNKYEKIITIAMLTIISLSNAVTPAVYAAQEVVSKLPAPAVADTKLAPSPNFHMDTGSVLGASTSLLTVGTQQPLDLQEGNTGSAHKRIAPRMQALTKKVYQTTEDISFAVTNPDDEAFTTTVADVDNKPAPVAISESNDGTMTTVQLVPSDELRPGVYKISVTDQAGNTTQQDFAWGVLALNFDKSMYHPGETGNIAIGVLNDKGDMVCDAKVQLKVQSANVNVADVLSTSASGSAAITINPQCQTHDFSLQPDYEAHYTFKTAGTYQMQLIATTQNGTHTISDAIQVTDQIPFDVQRVSATRIYPPNTYPMTFNITANKDFSGTVTETVPQDFTITPATGSATTNSYTNMQTMYLNANDPAAQLQQLIATSSAGLAMPFSGNYPITQGFGVQLTDPELEAFYVHYGLAGHDGVDFGLPMNTPLYAVDEGNIIWSGPGDYGITVIIQHGWGESYYGHLSNTSVTVGQHVTKGQLLGYSGESGEATGPHLHFGMKPLHPDITNGYYGKVDPLPYLPYNNQQSLALSTLNPTLTSLVNSAVLSASTSAFASDSAQVSPTESLTSIPTTQPTLSAAPSVTLPTPTSQSQPTPSLTPTIPASSGASVNNNFTVLDKQILLSEQLANTAAKVKVITWKISLKKGEQTTLGYEYQAPHVSPQFYLLGPLKFYQKGSGKIVFQEQRQWQIASDDVGVEWYQNTSGNKFNGYSWQYRKKLVIDHTKVSVAGTNATHVNSSSLSSSTLSSGHVDVTGVNAAAGDLIVVSAEAQTGHTTNGMSVKDLTNNANFTTITECDLSASSTRWQQTFYYQTPQALSNATVELTPYAGAINASMSVDIFRGVGTVQGVTATCRQAAAATTATGTSLSSAPYKNSLVLGFGASVDNMTPRTATYPWVGGSATSAGVNNPSTAIEYIASADGSTAYAGDFTVASTQSWAVVTATFNSASSQPNVTFMEAGGDATNGSTGDTNFTTGNKGFYASTGGTVTYDKTAGLEETGPGAIKATVANGGSNAFLATPTGSLSSSKGRISAYVYLDTSVNNGDILDLYSGSTWASGLEVTSGNKLSFMGTTGTTTLNTGQWYRIAIGYSVTSTSVNQAKVYINGTLELTSTNSTWSASSVDNFRIGEQMTGTASGTETIHFDDLYADAGTDLSDTGDVHVTAKLPIEDGDANSFTPNGTASGTACQSSNSSTHCQYINERPLNTTNFLQGPLTVTTEQFTIQNPAQGDVDISSDNILGEEAWIYAEMASGTTTCTTPSIYNNGTPTTISLTTSYAMYTSIATTTVYPDNYHAVGMDTCNDGSGTHTVNLAEAGTQIAYEAPASGSLANFPVLVSLTSDSDLSAHAQSNASDILFTDATGRNLLPFEIENYTAGTLKAWVNISSLSATSDTVIYMYYGNPAASSQANGTGTWNSNYGAVWHFTGGALPNTCGSTLGLSDSTSNTFTLTNHSTTATTGEICGGASFNGSTKYLQAANSSVFNPGANPFTATAWINESANNTYYTLFQHLNTTDDATGWQLYLNTGGCTSATSQWLCLWDGATDLGVYAGLAAGSWQQIAYVRLGNSVIFYVNGHEVGTLGSPNGDGVQTTFPSPGTFPEYLAHDPGQGAGFYSGSMDQFEYSQTNLTPGWIWTEYNDQSSPGVGGFIKSPLGTVETDLSAPTMSQVMRGGKWFDSTGTEQPFVF